MPQPALQINIAPSWSPILEADIAAAAILGNRIHTAYPEDYAVFHRHFEIYPSGFLALKEKTEAVLGYAIFHPWQFGAPPLLNQHLASIPSEVDCLHLHDIAIDESCRGRGHAALFMKILEQHAHAHGLSTLTLVAVSGTEAMWEKFGFERVDTSADRRACDSYSATSQYMALSLRDSSAAFSTPGA